MRKYTLEIDIPDGEFCACYSKPSEGRFCQFLGDSTASPAGLCHLIEGTPLLYCKGGDEDKMEHYDVVKHKDCPSLKG